MSLKEFTKDHIFTLTLSFLFFILLTFILYFASFNISLTVCILIVYILILITSFSYEYYKQKAYYDDLLSTVNALDKKYLVSDLISEPHTYQHSIMNEVLSQTNKAMNDHIHEYQETLKDYKDFIELWIHEVKIPLSTLKLMNKDQNKEINKELDRLDNDVDQVLYFIKSQSVSKDYIVKDVNLKDIVEEEVSLQRTLFIEKKINLSLNDLDCFVKSDSKWLSYIVKQILNNSLKYVEDNGNISIYTVIKEHELQLIIEDNGIGILPQDLPRVFDKGYTGDNGRTHYKASGLGLYLCKQLCHSLHHCISIESDQTTRVILSFPNSQFYKVL